MLMQTASSVIRGAYKTYILVHMDIPPSVYMFPSAVETVAGLGQCYMLDKMLRV